MTRCSVQPKNPKFVKGHGFLYFAKNMSKNIGKKVSGKYRQKLLDHAKQSAADVFKTVSKRAIQKTAKVTGDLTWNKIADKITKIFKALQQNSSESFESETKKQDLSEK